MKKRWIVVAAFSCLATLLHAQGVTVGAAGAADASSVLDIRSTTKGLLVPRMSITQRDQIANPADGLTIYQNTGVTGYYVYDAASTQWKQLGDNLGNHMLTQNLVTGSRYLSRTGNNTGLQLYDEYGSVRIRGFNENGNVSISHDLFRFDKYGGFVSITEGIGYGVIPSSGSGLRLMWHPFKGAFRAAYASVDQMDEANIGFYTWAGGNDPIATGVYSFAFGDAARATSTAAVAFGSSDTSSGTAAFTAGALCRASGSFSAAIGYRNIAGGTGSLALGYQARAHNNYCVALGYRASSGTYTGTMAMSDASTFDSVVNSANNQFVARYASGYRLYANATQTVGVYVTPGGNSWNSISDSTKKENFVAADGEYFLASLRKLKLGSWNYKGQASGNYRHYGPMAQEIFAAYGRDKLGTIGCDTLLASADMDGIMMVLLQALEKRSSDQLAVNKASNEKIAALEKQNQQVSEQLAALSAENRDLKEQLAKIASIQQQILAAQLAAKSESNMAVRK